jgi:hypothetical protein
VKKLPAVDYHGWTLKALKAPGGAGSELVSLHIGRFPDRRQVCLYVQEGVTIWPLAYFTSEERAQKLLDVLDRLILGRR